MNVAARPAAPPGVRRVREVADGAGFPLYVHPDWRDEYPWLAQGITGRAGGAPFDMTFFGDTPAAVAYARWTELRRVLGIGFVAHARQVHGARVLSHDPGHEGILLADAADGHAASHAGVLMAVTVADCVPVSVIDPDRRAAALLHAGWRGVAAGILETGMSVLRDAAGGTPRTFRVHLGPAICGACYEVGPEVHAALGLDAVDRPTTLDLRATLAVRAAAFGLRPEHITVSDHCTRCGGGGFHSHRGGDRERQVAVLGVRAAGG